MLSAPGVRWPSPGSRRRDCEVVVAGGVSPTASTLAYSQEEQRQEEGGRSTQKDLTPVTEVRVLRGSASAPPGTRSQFGRLPVGNAYPSVASLEPGFYFIEEKEIGLAEQQLTQGYPPFFTP